ncbi:MULTISPECIES: hypothetical protein [Pseudomonas]|uniref:hypothetical protein n=1 Tax=Pseudomonas TaxID=286 RepID=UPI001B3290EA|nr:MULTISPECIES: hypothetical protein [Pseudomonas]MBP5967801.1 hypothetical protein [Pseudomonas iridis]UHC82934.1 hypothetical protein LS633_03655 [Pseudomonas sp. NIBR-H-19]
MNMQHLNNAGKLDLDFGKNGVMRIEVPGYPEIYISSVGIGPDGKIYFAGTTTPFQGERLYLLGRCNSDGSMDSEFGNEGFVTGAVDGFDVFYCDGFAFQADGKILIAYRLSSDRVLEGIGVARHDISGQLDREFGTNGRTLIDIQLSPPAAEAPPEEKRAIGGSGGSSSGIQVLPDGKILVCKSYWFNLQKLVGLIVRLDKNGALDLDFNQIGYVTVAHPDYLTRATILRSIMVQADGKYLGCGNVFDGAKKAGMFVRYDTTGKLDPTFGKGGFVQVEDAQSPMFNVMVQQPNQRILGVGETSTKDNGASAAVMYSLEPDGSPNIQFNRGKPLYTELAEELVTAWLGAGIQKDGKAVTVGGVGKPNGEVDIALMRTIDGKLDPTFNDGQGWVTTHLESGVEVATDMVLQDDGKILICAGMPNKTGALLRYHG